MHLPATPLILFYRVKLGKQPKLVGYIVSSRTLARDNDGIGIEWRASFFLRPIATLEARRCFSHSCHVLVRSIRYGPVVVMVVV